MPVLVLGVSGSVAAYRAADLARDLMRAGFTVRVCLTESAQNFVSSALFEALTGQPCLTSVFEEPIPGRMAHIDWAREADVVLVAPATANVLNKAAAGIADDMLTTLMLVHDRPVLFAPAMNPSMYHHETTQASLATLQTRGHHLIEPAEGDVACGENGQGKLAANEVIVQQVLEFSRFTNLLEGKKVLLTGGPTREPIDDVRFLSNRSSGKMAAALAQAAAWMGAKVTVVSGPVEATYPLRASVRFVETATQMLDACLEYVSGADVIIGCAAVADYRVENVHSGKIRRTMANLELKLIPNPDIIAELASRSQGRVVGFAAEPSADPVVAQEKLKRKGLYAIAANDVSRGDIGFGSDFNEITLVFRDGRTIQSGRRSKLACARWLLEHVLSPGQTE